MICLTVVLFSLALIPLHAQDEVVPDTVKTVDAPDSLGMSAPLYAPFVRPYGLWGGIYSCLPTFYGAGPDSWKLHEGFNAQFSLSVTAGLGSHAPRGVGFGQDAAFMYAQPPHRDHAERTQQRYPLLRVYRPHIPLSPVPCHRGADMPVYRFYAPLPVFLSAYGTGK